MKMARNHKFAADKLEIVEIKQNSKYQNWGGNDSWDIVFTDGKNKFKTEGLMCIGKPTHLNPTDNFIFEEVA